MPKSTKLNIHKDFPILPDKTPGKNGYTYKEKFGVIVLCEDESHHKEVYTELHAAGYKCKVVRV